MGEKERESERENRNPKIFETFKNTLKRERICERRNRDWSLSVGLVKTNFVSLGHETSRWDNDALFVAYKKAENLGEI